MHHNVPVYVFFSFTVFAHIFLSPVYTVFNYLHNLSFPLGERPSFATGRIAIFIFQYSVSLFCSGGEKMKNSELNDSISSLRLNQLHSD